MTTARRLRELLARPAPLLIPNVYDALTAKAAQWAGFDAIFMGGSGVAAGLLGLPDLGYLTRTDAVTVARNIVNAVDVPVIADCDDGYGNSLTAARTVREFEGCGLAGIMIEDQASIMRPPHVGGVTVLPRDRFVGKIRAAVQARRDPDFVIIARTDAIGPEGFEEVVGRANACAAAGADLVFLAGIGQLSPEQRGSAPKRIAAPLASTGQLESTGAEGYRVVLCANVQAVIMKTLLDYLAQVKTLGGDHPSLADRSQSWQDFDTFMGLSTTLRTAIAHHAEPAKPTSRG